MGGKRRKTPHASAPARQRLQPTSLDNSDPWSIPRDQDMPTWCIDNFVQELEKSRKESYAHSRSPIDEIEWASTRFRDSPVWYEDAPIRAMERRMRGLGVSATAVSSSPQVSGRNEPHKQSCTNDNRHVSQLHSGRIPLGRHVSSPTAAGKADQVITAHCSGSQILAIDQQLLPSTGGEGLSILNQLAHHRPESVFNMLWYSPTTLGSIGVLPVELQEMVFGNLSWDGAIHLAATNKWYRRNIKPFDHGTFNEKVTFLQAQEKRRGFTDHRPEKNWFACTGCWSMKRQTEFALQEVVNPRKQKGGNAWRKRRCLACQVGDGYHRESAEIINGGQRSMRLCKPCGQFQTGLHCFQCHRCETCMGELIGIRCPFCFNYPLMPHDEPSRR